MWFLCMWCVCVNEGDLQLVCNHHVWVWVGGMVGTGPSDISPRPDSGRLNICFKTLSFSLVLSLSLNLSLVLSISSLSVSLPLSLP